MKQNEEQTGLRHEEKCHSINVLETYDKLSYLCIDMDAPLTNGLAVVLVSCYHRGSASSFNSFCVTVEYVYFITSLVFISLNYYIYNNCK